MDLDLIRNSFYEKRYTEIGFAVSCSSPHKVFIHALQYSNVRTVRRPANICTIDSQTILLANPFWFRKIITDPHSFAHMNIDCQDVCIQNLKFISQN
jgi:hypothetical protein